MALLVEDGTGIDGANSYNSVLEIRDYAASRGATLPVDDSAVEILAIKAADYLDVKDWKGRELSPLQGLAWPRSFVDTDDALEISYPKEIKKAQCQLVIEAMTGDLMPSTRPGKYKRTRVEGAIDVEYPSFDEARAQPSFRLVEALIRPFLVAGAGLRTVRI